MKKLYLVLMLSFMSVPAQADFFKGNEAYEDKDYSTAFKEWQYSAMQGVGEAQNNLGMLYENGQGVPKDYAQAFKWYGKAAEQGHAKAQYNLGAMYDNGEGVTQDPIRAANWYRKAAEQGISRP